MITLTPLREFRFPIIAECISPDAFKGKNANEIADFAVWEGNKQKKLSDVFKIEQSSDETPSITIDGNVEKVRHIGSGMTSGQIVINGNVGMHLGEKMAEGKITVNGDADGWAGSDMKNGLIEITGNAGPYLASPYRGSSVGMKGGKIIVHGNVGTDAAAFMKGGLIKIRGDSGPFLGFRMCDGTVHVEKNAGTRSGACMTGGKIVVSGIMKEVLPSFTIDSVKPKVKIEEGESASGPFYVFIGDLAENGTGKIFISKNLNAHLRKYERFL